jgi:hypothetical protein
MAINVRAAEPQRNHREVRPLGLLGGMKNNRRGMQNDLSRDILLSKWLLDQPAGAQSFWRRLTAADVVALGAAIVCCGAG